MFANLATSWEEHLEWEESGLGVREKCLRLLCWITVTTVSTASPQRIVGTVGLQLFFSLFFCVTSKDTNGLDNFVSDHPCGSTKKTCRWSIIIPFRVPTTPLPPLFGWNKLKLETENRKEKFGIASRIQRILQTDIVKVDHTFSTQWWIGQRTYNLFRSF